MEDVRALDNISFSEWFEGKGGSRGSIKRMWDPIAYALVRHLYFYSVYDPSQGHGTQEKVYGERRAVSLGLMFLCVKPPVSGLHRLRQHQRPLHAHHLPALRRAH